MDQYLNRYMASKDRDYLRGFLLQGSIAILDVWIRGGCRDEPKHTAELIYNCCRTIDPYADY